MAVLQLIRYLKRWYTEKPFNNCFFRFIMPKSSAIRLVVAKEREFKASRELQLDVKMILFDFYSMKKERFSNPCQK